MKSAPFAYARPETLEEALALLAEHGEDGRVLAGGQSLVPMMNFRLAQPEVLIDVNRLADLSGIAGEGEATRIGALVRYAALGRAQGLPLLPLAMPLVAHPGVRNRGTAGGSVALADPAAEMPACCVCLGAEIGLESAARGRRHVPAAEFFHGIYETARADDEMVVELRVPGAERGRRHAIRELAPRHGDFALAGLAVGAELAGNHLAGVRIATFAVGERPVLAERAASALEGARADDAAAVAEAGACLAGEIEVRADASLDAEQRRQVLRALLGRALADIGRDADGG